MKITAMKVTTANYVEIYNAIPSASKSKEAEEFHKLAAASSKSFKNWEYAKEVLPTKEYPSWLKDREEAFALIGELAKDNHNAPSHSNEDEELELAEAEAQALKLKLKLLKI